MRGSEEMRCRFSPRSAAAIAALLSSICLLLFGLLPGPGTAGSHTTTATIVTAAALSDLESGSVIDASKVMGYRACVMCHRTETLAWMGSKHFQSELKIRSFEGNVEKYCEALGITKAGLKSSICAECHATPKTNAAGVVRLDGGVSCESCHGAAGSDSGWLNRHAVYGPIGTRPDRESPEHKAARMDYCANAGMVRTDRIYAIAKNCQSCHTIASEKLVNAGHKAATEGFDVLGWTNGEVRHNFHQQQAANADGPSLWAWRTNGSAANRKRVMYLVGLLVDIEVSLNALAGTQEGEGDYVDAFVDKLGGSLEVLQEVLGEVFEDEIPEDLSGFGEDGELAEALAEAAEGDFTEEETRTMASELAKKVAAAAMTVGKRNGSKLDALGEFIQENVEAKGEPYQLSQ